MYLFVAVIPIMIYLDVKPTIQLLWMVPLGMLLSTILAMRRWNVGCST